MKKLIATSILLLSLTGCSTFYAYKGQVYQVTGQGEFGRLDGSEFTPLPKGELLNRVARDGKAYNYQSQAEDEASAERHAEKKEREETQKVIDELNEIVGTSPVDEPGGH